MALWPLALLYGGITRLRNVFFDYGIFPVYAPPVFSVGVGNLAVGGTGKTPFISFLIAHFSGKKIAVLSRGYGRKTKGFREVEADESCETVGDEIFMLYERHQSQALFFVCEDRTLGVKEILKRYPQTEVILFDDVFQHRHVLPAFQLVLSTHANPYFQDFMLPMGKLRESRKGIRRADVLIYTKCPENVDYECLKARSKKGIPVFFSVQELGGTENAFGKTLQRGTKANVLSALADNVQFAESVNSDYEIEQVYAFSDHHAYTLADIEKMDFSLPTITSEKDFVKIKALLNDTQLAQVFVRKIKSKIVSDEDRFYSVLDKAFDDFQSRFNV